MVAQELSENHLRLIIAYLELFHNDTKDFQVPHLRKSIQYVYPLFVFLYAIIIIIGTCGNGYVIVTILRHRLHVDPTYYFLCNLALADIIKCIFVLPITLANLLILNWLFGSFLCYFIPMMQYIPIHASMLTFLLIAVDRYRMILFPLKSRVPRFICFLGLWVLSICVALPFAIYITYIELGDYFGPGYEGTGLCTVNVEDDMEEYLRGIFIVMYVLPLAIISFLHVRISGEIKAHETPLSTINVDISSADERSLTTQRSNSDPPYPTEGPGAQVTLPKKHDDRDTTEGASVSPKCDDFNSTIQWRREFSDDNSFNLCKEKRTQKYLITMVTLFAACLCPLEIMKLVKHIVTETYDNTGHFDLAYIIFVWIGFLPTCITPILFSSWRMSQPVKDRLRGYL